jgi:hypothetical protein
VREAEALPVQLEPNPYPVRRASSSQVSMVSLCETTKRTSEGQGEGTCQVMAGKRLRPPATMVNLGRRSRSSVWIGPA